MDTPRGRLTGPLRLRLDECPNERPGVSFFRMLSVPFRAVVSVLEGAPGVTQGRFAWTPASSSSCPYSFLQIPVQAPLVRWSRLVGAPQTIKNRLLPATHMVFVL